MMNLYRRYRLWREERLAGSMLAAAASIMAKTRAERDRASREKLKAATTAQLRAEIASGYHARLGWRA